MKINDVLRYPEKIPCDKRLHFIIGVIAMMIMKLFNTPRYISYPALVFLAYAIEFYQKLTKSGHFEHYDALAVVLGGLCVDVGDM